MCERIVFAFLLRTCLKSPYPKYGYRLRSNACEPKKMQNGKRDYFFCKCSIGKPAKYYILSGFFPLRGLQNTQNTLTVIMVALKMKGKKRITGRSLLPPLPESLGRKRKIVELSRKHYVPSVNNSHHKNQSFVLYSITGGANSGKDFKI